MHATTAIALYQHRSPEGHTLRQYAGLALEVKPGDDPKADSSTVLVGAAGLYGHAPAAGDRLRTADGSWRVVREVGEPADGAYPCLCDREKR
jgi:hypothetical protein